MVKRMAKCAAKATTAAYYSTTQCIDKVNPFIDIDLSSWQQSHHQLSQQQQIGTVP
jgi:hypothetical protein